MFKGIFSSRKTTKADVILAIGTALAAVWKASDTIKEFRAQQAEENKEITE